MVVHLDCAHVLQGGVLMRHGYCSHKRQVKEVHMNGGMNNKMHVKELDGV